MSSIRDPAVITSVGRQMMAAGGDITYTKAILYGQDISHLTKEQLEGLTSIGSPLLTVPVGISDKNTAGNNNTVVLESTFQNASLKADLSYTAVGFFAKRGDGDEKLIIICVANPGAVLIATPPDGVATDALDIKVAIAIGDATNVTAVIDPAGSVTPATLNGAINKLSNDLTAQIDTKANKTDVNAALDTKADKTQLPDLSPYARTADVNASLDTKADKTQLPDLSPYAKLEDVNKALDTKADKSELPDLSPYAKTETVNAALSGKDDTTDVDAKIKTVTELANSKADQTAVDKINTTLANKADSDYSYSKAELDKKLLALSTDTSGKVDANQVASIIANKVDKSDLASDLKSINDSIATKANTTDVNTALAKKDDTTDVDAKIKTVTDLANTKANSADVYTKSAVDTAFSQRDSNITKAQNEVDQLKGRRTVDSADFNSLTDGGTYYISKPAKNAPVSQWGNLFVSNGNGHRVSQVYFPDDGNAPWYRVLDEQDWRGWVQLGTKSDISNGLSTKVDKSQVNLDGNLYYADHSDHNKGSDILGQTISSGFLKAIVNYNESPDSNALSDATTFAAGDGDAGAMISISANDHHAKLLGYGNVNGQPNWTEDIAFKSDINNINNALNTKANTSDVNSALNTKANTSDVSALQNKVNVDDNLYSAPGSVTSWASLQADGSKNVLRSVRTEGAGTDFNTGNYDAGILFGGNDTKALISVAYTGNRAIVTGGNNQSVWHEDIAWKSDINNVNNQINSTNQTVSALQQTIKTLNDTLSSANATIKTLQDTITKQDTTITGLQTQVNNQANEIKQLQETTIKGKTFSKSQEAAAEAWEKQNSQQIAFILDN